MNHKLISLLFIIYVVSARSIAQDSTVLSVDKLIQIPIEELLNVKIISASRYQEPIYESPVPVTIITGKMIEMSGVDNFEELLLLYVPGMTDIQDGDDPNISMRGVFGTNQQKILIMLNGHRLNIRTVNSAFPDYINSLDKIKQVEILRGPASSMYGNVALTSVINIITKKGEDVNGIEINTGIGSFGQKSISYTGGNNFIKHGDVFFWGSIYQADGEKYAVDKSKDYSPHPKKGHAYIGGVKDIPAFDFGGIYNVSDIEFMFNYRGSSIVLPYSSTGLGGEVYNYNNYRTFHGYGPGTGVKSFHLDGKYHKEFNTFKTLLNVYGDNNSLESNHVSDPFIKQQLITEYDDIAFGSIFQLDKKYTFNNSEGKLTTGIQFEQMRVYEGMSFQGNGGWQLSAADSAHRPFTEKGHEESYSSFVQIKHKFNTKFILNIGSRYDYKTRRKGKNIHSLSPRMAMVYKSGKSYSLKLSYSRSFVDAAYFYRYNNTDDFQGSIHLKPEYLQSCQVSQSINLFKNKINLHTNIFHNRLTDVIYRDPNAVASEGDPKYINAGELTVAGMENEISYTSVKYTCHANFTVQGSLSSKDYGTDGYSIHNVPNIFGNVVMNYRPLYKFFPYLNLNIAGRYIGKQRSPVHTYLNETIYTNLSNTVDEAFLINTGLRIEDYHQFDVEIQITNILNTRYYQGGTVQHPYPQKGRWIIFKLGYTIPL